MVSGTNKIRVVWLCHFANKAIKEHFNTSKVNELAPWINLLIQLFKGNTQIELHVVAPNVFTNKNCSFKIEGVIYHFYSRIPLIGHISLLKKAYTFLKIEQLTNFYWTSRKIVTLVNKIEPDIIHLHGAENPYYSAGIIPLLNKYPVLTTIQGFIRHSSSNDYIVRKRIYLEDKIIRNCKHFGTRTDEMSKAIFEINPKARLHFHNYPITIPSVVKDNIGKDEPIDCLFFARLTKDKGIEDLLEAISIVKQKIMNIRLTVIGGCNEQYLIYLNTRCTQLQIESNVKFLGFLTSQNEIYQYAIQSKICVLPTHHDIISGTIIESMLMKLPVIAYSVGSIPELNTKDETVGLVEKGKIEELAKKIILFLNNPELRKTLAEKAYLLAQNRFNKNEEIVSDIVKAYNTTIDDYKNL